MHYLQYYPLDVVNGEGTRCTLFVSGCEHFCKGCHNSSTWPSKSGHLFTDELEAQIISDLGDQRIRRDGLSLSGGDPLFPANQATILKLVKKVKMVYPDKTIWLWTGYRLDDLSPMQQAIIKYVDVLIDGKFELEKRDLSLPWRGSSNQRLLYLNKNNSLQVPA